MKIKAKLATWSPSGKRAERRRVLNLAGRLHDRGTEFAEVDAQDFLPTGCTVSPKGRARVGDTVWLKLTGLEPMRCRVLWADGEEAGCWFERRLHSSEIIWLREQVMAKPNPSPSGVFGRKGVEAANDAPPAQGHLVWQKLWPSFARS